MKHRTRSAFPGLALLILCAWPIIGAAQQPKGPPPEHPAASTTAPSKGEAPATPAADEAIAPETDVSDEVEPTTDTEDTGHHAESIVSIGHDSRLEAGKKADVVVSVFGSSTSEGDVSETVVSVFGDTRVTGPVGQGAVAVMGNLYIDSKVDGDAVAVLGNLELGPHAEITGETVMIGGVLKRAETAITHGGVEQILGGYFGSMQWLRPWLKHCLLLGRPLALEPGLGWAWSLALGFLALYVLFAVMFRDGIEKCIRTFEEHPGRTVLASFLALILSPIMFCVLAITVVGLVAFPFLLFVAGMFGKAAILALIGGRITRSFRNETLEHPAISVLIGGAIMLALYLVPFVGFIVYKLFGILALGLVVYTVILSYRSNTPRPAAATVAAAAPAGSGPDAAFASAEAVGTAPGTAPGTETPPRPAEPIITDLTALPRAGFWARMGALFIDFVIVAVAINLVIDSDNLLLLLLATYGAVMWKLKGTTVGGVVLGLKVARLDGRPVDWSTAIVRALGCFLSLVVVGLGFIWIIFDDDRQAWHDKIAGTVVVRVPKGVSLV